MNNKSPVLDLNSAQATRRSMSSRSSDSAKQVGPAPASESAPPPKDTFREMTAKARLMPYHGLIGVNKTSLSASKRDIVSLVLMAAAGVGVVVLVVLFIRDPAGMVNFVKTNWPYITAVCAYVGVDITQYVRRLLQRLNLPVDLIPAATPPSREPST